MGKVTIYTGWGGEVYTADYVNRLYRSCVRNMSRPFDFVLLAGPSVTPVDENIKVIETGLPYWWAGMVFWKLSGVRLFIDLDVVIVGNMEPLFVEGDHVCSRDLPGREDANPGVTLIRGDAGQWVWDEYERCGKPVWDPFDHTDHSFCYMAAQGILNEKRGYTLYPYETVVSYKIWARENGVPKGCVGVHFHGRPKPHEVKEAWVKEAWQ